MKKLLLANATAFSALSAVATKAFAAPDSIAINTKDAGFKIEDLGKLITAGLNLFLGIAGFLVFVFLIWGGIEWLTAGGDKSKTESARTKITNAIIGLAIIASAFAIGAVLTRFLGVNVGTSIAIPQGY